MGKFLKRNLQKEFAPKKQKPNTFYGPSAIPRFGVPEVEGEETVTTAILTEDDSELLTEDSTTIDTEE